MVIPTVANMPQAAMPTPYNPAKYVETKITPAMQRIGATTDSIPTARPVIMTVAVPVFPDSAMRSTGLLAV